jgi:hypothetical protein
MQLAEALTLRAGNLPAIHDNEMPAMTNGTEHALILEMLS